MTVTFDLPSFPIEQVRELRPLEWSWGNWFAANPFPMRLLALSQAFDMRQPLKRLERDRDALAWVARAAAPLITALNQQTIIVRTTSGGIVSGSTALATPAAIRSVFSALDADTQHGLLATFGDDPTLLDALAYDTIAHWQAVAQALAAHTWPLAWQNEMLLFYHQLARRHLRAARFYLLAWPPADVATEGLLATARQAFGREVHLCDYLPSVIDCTYSEQGRRLAPSEPGHPWLSVLSSYDVRGAWDLTTLHPLLNGTDDVALAIDITTVPKAKAQRDIEMAYTAATVVTKDQSMKDVRGERVKAHADYALHALTQQGFHHVQIQCLVSGETPQALDTNLAAMRGSGGSQLRLMHVSGAQGELIKYFSPTPTKRIDAPRITRNMLSHGVGCCAGVLTYHRNRQTAGLLWGLDAVRRSAVFYDLFLNNQAGHCLILGMTGYGKTVFINEVSARAAAIMGYRVIGIDDFDNGPRVARAFGPGAHCYDLGLHTPINILDIVYDRDAEGGWMPNQVLHAIGQISLLLGTPTKSADGKDRLLPYDCDPAERGILDSVLTNLYAPHTPDTPLDQMPLLDDLITMLVACPEPEAQHMARMLTITLYGTADRTRGRLNQVGRCFNAHTEVDWSFGHDLTYYNTAGVPERLRPFFYLQIIGAILRFMRQRRDRSRKTLLMIDEFGHVTGVEALARLAATICKVARKYGIALIPVDQNPGTFLDNPSGQFIWENCVGKIMFHLDDTAARRVAESISALAPVHIEFIKGASFGQACAVFRNTAYLMNVELSPQEYRAFVGS